MMISRSGLTSQTLYEKATLKLVLNKGTSKGVAEKYTDGNIWVKADLFGYEGLAETIASRAVKALGFKTVEYNPCLLGINEYDAKTACVSASFLKEGFAEYSVGRVLEQYYDCKNSKELLDLLYSYTAPEQRLSFILNGMKTIVPEDILLTALADYVWIDNILLNTDRHVFNMVFLSSKNEQEFINFDYGASLLSDLEDFPRQMPLKTAMYSAKSKPFSTRFSSQVKLFEKYLPTSYNHSITVDVADLYSYYGAVYINRAMEVLKQRLLLNGISCTFLTRTSVTIYSPNAGKLQRFSSLINYDMRGMYYVTTFIKEKTELSDCFKFDNNERAVNFCLNNPNEVVAYVPNW